MSIFLGIKNFVFCFENDIGLRGFSSVLVGIRVGIMEAICHYQAASTLAEFVADGPGKKCKGRLRNVGVILYTWVVVSSR